MSLKISIKRELDEIEKKAVEKVLERAEVQVKAAIELALLESGAISTEEVLYEVMQHIHVSMEDNGIEVRVDSSSMAEKIDQGQESWSIAEYMLNNSSKVKTGKDGYRYVDIPMTGNERSPVVGGGRELSDFLQEFGTGRDMSAVEKRQNEENVVRFQEMLRKVGGASQRNPRNDQYKGQGAVIRRISERNLGDGRWQHPGFKGIDFANRVPALMERTINLEASRVIQQEKRAEQSKDTSLVSFLKQVIGGGKIEDPIDLKASLPPEDPRESFSYFAKGAAFGADDGGDVVDRGFSKFLNVFKGKL